LSALVANKALLLSLYKVNYLYIRLEYRDECICEIGRKILSIALRCALIAYSNNVFNANRKVSSTTDRTQPILEMCHRLMQWTAHTRACELAQTKLLSYCYVPNCAEITKDCNWRL